MLKSQLPINNDNYLDYSDSGELWLWEMGPNLAFTNLSANFETITGWKPDSVLGKQFEEICAENNFGGDVEVYCARMKNREPFRGIEFWKENDNVDRQWLTISGHPVFNADGRFLGYRGMGSDKTLRKHEEWEYEQNAATLEGILNSSLDSVLVLKAIRSKNGNIADFSIIRVNSKAEELLGVSSEQLLGRLVTLEIPVFITYGLFDCSVETIKTGEAFDIELPIDREELNGWFRIVGVVMGDGIVLTISDITHHKLAESKLLQTSKLASLGEMATGVAHELNQPLNVIQMATDVLIESLEEGKISPDFLRQKLTRISEQVVRAAAITNHMRTFGQDDPQGFTSFSIIETIIDAIGIIREQYRSHNIELVVDLPETCNPVIGQKIQMEQVILNLLSNARHAIEDNNKQYTEPDQITLKVMNDPDADQVHIIVNDNGGGIPEDSIGKVFDLFYTTKDTGAGAGVGLSVAYGIIANMGGDISVVNTDHGAEFTISLPAIPENQISAETTYSAAALTL